MITLKEKILSVLPENYADSCADDVGFVIVSWYDMVHLSAGFVYSTERPQIIFEIMLANIAKLIIDTAPAGKHENIIKAIPRIIQEKMKDMKFSYHD